MAGTVLLTGGSGLLALNWALAVRDSHRVVLGTHTRTVFVRAAECVPLDLESEDGIQRTLDAVQPDVVVHTVALTNVDECEKAPALARHVNVALATSVARVCARRATRLVHVSSDHLFSGTEACVDEEQPPSPCNVYGRTKFEAEQRVLDACPEALVVRTNFYGWGPPYRRSFSDAIVDALRAGRAVTLFADVFYTPILIEPLVVASHELVSRHARGIYHVTGDDRVSKLEFGHAVAAEFGLDPALIRSSALADRPELVRRPRDMSLSNEKACRLLGRSIGGVATQVACLHEQERRGDARELAAA